MKIESYSICGPVKGLFKSNCILGKQGANAAPLVYLVRPKWIQDDDQWKAILNGITLNLPSGFEITREEK